MATKKKAILAGGLGGVQVPPLPVWRQVKANILAGTGRGRIACIGNSTVRGQGGGTGTNNLVNSAPFSWPNKLAAKLAAGGLPSNQDSVTGFGLSPAQDARVITNGAWAQDVISLGGPTLKNGTDTALLSFAFTGTTDTYVIWYIQISGNGTFTASIGATVLGTINSGSPATNALRSVTVTGTRGVNQIDIARTGVGGNVYILGVDAYDSTVATASVFNMGIGGSVIATHTSTASVWSNLNAIGTFAPDLSVISCQINDETAGTAIPTFTASYQTLITKCKLSGDVVLVVDNAINTSQASAATQANFTAALYALAATNRLRIVDIPKLHGDWATTNANSLMYDTKHPDAAFYDLIAQDIATPLLAA